MAYCSKPSNKYRQKSMEEQVLPRLFTPNKALRAHDWLRSGNYGYDEKLDVLKTFWLKDEERKATDKVLKESFHPRVAPRVRVWLNEATAEEKKAITKLFRYMASQPTSDKTTTAYTKPEQTITPSTNILTANLPTMNPEATKDQNAQRRKVKWGEGYPTIKAHNHGDKITVAQMRTEFDIAPDWRAPKRSVVPMTQVARPVPTQERLPRLSKHICLHRQREFVIHPEWIIH